MKKITRSALLEVPVELAYQVVVDVEAYPDFLPGCERVEVLKRTDTGVEVKVTVSGAGIKQKFVTVNRHDPNMITMSLKKGPFKALEGAWHFTQIGDRGCRVEVDLEFEADGMLATLFTPIADVVANKLVDAFCERMDTVQTGGAHIGRQH